jgi:hypothetical protein
MANNEDVVFGSLISGTIYNGTYKGTFGDLPVVVKKIENEQKCTDNQLKQLLNLDCENVVKYLAYRSDFPW